MSIRSITNAKNTKVGIRNKSQHPTRTILQRISWIYPEGREKTTTYYVLDWTEVIDGKVNTISQSNSPYYQSKDPNNHPARFNGMNITAQIHTHPSTYYNGKHSYDGNSQLDYNWAKDTGVPVYSIGPISVSRITSQSKFTSEEELGIGDYGLRDKDSMREVNPFFFELTSTWLLNPHLY